ncbi:MAG: hypothetical protein Q4A01_09550 [Coriobacteriales bacterium]|nr:hypothetical protein [Coriobacteriales bacterium]
MRRVGVFHAISVVLAAMLCVCLPACGKGQPAQENPVKQSDLVNMPAESEELVGRDCQEVMDLLTQAGFTNVVAKPHEDLMVGLLHNDGEVEKITVNGTTEFTTETSYPHDQEIVITYHTYQVDIDQPGQ